MTDRNSDSWEYYLFRRKTFWNKNRLEQWPVGILTCTQFTAPIWQIWPVRGGNNFWEKVYFR